MKISGIKIIRLINNEEIIGDMTSHSDVVTVHRPAILNVSAAEGGLQVELFPYAPYAVEDKFTFSLDHILTAFTPDEQMTENYNRIINPVVSDVVAKDNVVDLNTAK